MALAHAAEMDSEAAAAVKVCWSDTFDLEHASRTLEGIAQTIQSVLQKVAPAKTIVELEIKNAQPTTLLVSGQTDTSLRVTLEWDREQSLDDSVN